MNRIREYIEQCSKEESPVGDLAKDILRDDAISDDPDEDRFFEYLEEQTSGKVSEEAFIEFKAEYLRKYH